MTYWTLPLPTQGFPIPPPFLRAWFYARWRGLTWWAHGRREAASGVWKVTFSPWTVVPMLWPFPHQSWFPQCSECAWRGNGKKEVEGAVGDELITNTSPHEAKRSSEAALSHPGRLHLPCSLILLLRCSFARIVSPQMGGGWGMGLGEVLQYSSQKAGLTSAPLGLEILWYNSPKMSGNPTACTALQMPHEAQDQWEGLPG